MIKNDIINVNDIKTIVFDMDGTTLTDDKKIDSKLSNISKKIKNKGINFVLATGRMREMAYLYMEQLGMEDAIIAACNGGDIGYLEHEKRERSIFLSKFPLDISYKLLEEAEKLNLIVHVFSTKGMLSKVSTKRLQRYLKNNESLDKNHQTPVFIGEEYMSDIYLKGAIKFFMDGDSIHQIETFIERIKPLDLEIVFSGEMAIDINLKGINKGYALKVLNEKKIINLNNTMAFGDNFNDIPMFELVKYPIAMANSQKETKEKAIDVCECNNINGVGKYLEKLFEL